MVVPQVVLTMQRHRMRFRVAVNWRRGAPDDAASLAARRCSWKKYGLWPMMRIETEMDESEAAMRGAAGDARLVAERAGRSRFELRLCVLWSAICGVVNERLATCVGT